MGYRVVADENIERATVHYLRKLGHDVDWVGDIPELGLGVEDHEIVAYARETNRLILTQDDDFFTAVDIDETSGVLFQRDQTLSGREVGDAVHEIAEYIDQADVTLEYVSRNWL